MNIEIKRKSDEEVEEHLRQLFITAYEYSHQDMKDLIHFALMSGATKEEILPFMREKIQRNTQIQKENGQYWWKYETVNDVPDELIEAEFQQGHAYHLKEVAKIEAMTEEELREDYEFFREGYASIHAMGGNID